MFSRVHNKTANDNLRDVVYTPGRKPVLKARLLSYMLDEYIDSGRLLFTSNGLAIRHDSDTDAVRGALFTMKNRGLVGSNEKCIVRCGKFESVLRDTVWFLTKEGLHYATDREIDFESVSGEYLLITDAKKLLPASEFILEINEHDQQ